MVPYYHAFLERFPDPDALAAAPAADVLAAWSGLGYNRRALALQRAAAVVAEHGWPEDLTELPGVGAYTAAAVASFAWDAQAVAVDTNVRRVICRHDGAEHGPRALAGRAAELMPAGPGGAVQPGDDGAGRDGLPPAPARVRRLPGAAAAARPRAARRSRRRARPLGASASRTATAGRADGSSPRWWRASRRRCSPRRAAPAPRPVCCATGSPCAAPMARCGCRRIAPMREVVLTVRPDDVEEVLDRILPLLPQGVHETPAPGGTVALAAFGTRPAAGRARGGGRRGPARRPGGRGAGRSGRKTVEADRGAAAGRGGHGAAERHPGARGRRARRRHRLAGRRVRRGHAPDDRHVPGAADGARAGRSVRRPRLRHWRARHHCRAARLAAGVGRRPRGARCRGDRGQRAPQPGRARGRPRRPARARAAARADDRRQHPARRPRAHRGGAARRGAGGDPLRRL